MRPLLAFVMLFVAAISAFIMLASMESRQEAETVAAPKEQAPAVLSAPVDGPELKAWLEKLEAVAGQGNPDAQFETAMVYLDEASYASQRERGLYWLTEAAEQDHVRAMELLGALYYRGQYVEAQPQLAHQWILKAAQADSSYAQVILARMYFDGIGVSADPVAGFNWAQTAMRSRDPAGLLALATAYQHAYGTPCDLDEARRLYEQAVAQGDGAVSRSAQDKLTQLQEAAQWFEGYQDMATSAAAGEAQAQFLFGYVHAWGLCTRVDFKQALAWMERAAAQGLAPAQQAAHWLQTQLAENSLAPGMIQ